MSWIIYDVDTLEVKYCVHIKDKAKAILRYVWSKPDGYMYNYKIDKVNLTKLDEWKVWKTLCK